MKHSLPAILDSRPLPSGCSLDSLYRICRELFEGVGVVSAESKASAAEDLYTAVEETLSRQATLVGRALRGTLLAGDSEPKGIAFLKQIMQEWTAWEAASNRLMSVLLYLDRVYVLRSSDKVPLK